MEARAFTDTRARLREAADALVNESIDGVTTSELGADIIEIRLAVDRLEAECLRRLHRFHADRGALSDGGGTTVSWLRRSCGDDGESGGVSGAFGSDPRGDAGHARQCARGSRLLYQCRH